MYNDLPTTYKQISLCVIVMEEFQDNIQKWVAVDTQLKALNEQAKRLRERRGELADNIHIHVDTHNLANAIVNISDGKLRFSSIKQTAPLTLKYVEKCLHECIEEDEQVAHIMSIIKQSRSVTVAPDIKRSYDE